MRIKHKSVQRFIDKVSKGFNVYLFRYLVPLHESTPPSSMLLYLNRDVFVRDDLENTKYFYSKTNRTLEDDI